MNPRLVRWLTLAISLICYATALALPAYRDMGYSDGMSGGKFTLSGLGCLISPVAMTPVVLLIHPSWLANPLLAGGLVTLLLRRYTYSLAFGVIAICFALLVFAEDRNPYDPGAEKVLQAVWFWLAAMGTVVAGTFVLVAGGLREQHCT